MVWPIVHEITETLAISDIYAAQDAKTLDRYGITHVVSLLSFATIQTPSHVSHLKLDILDYEDENILDELPKLCDWIEQAIHSKKMAKVLIHCQAGISRSSTTLAAYLMRSQKITRDEALALIRSKRSVIRPNPGFLDQLQVWYDCDFDPQKDDGADNNSSTTVDENVVAPKEQTETIKEDMGVNQRSKPKL